MADELAIKVEQVSKTFKLPHEKTSSIKSAVVNFYRRRRTFEKQEALRDISFEVKKGEFFGIIGRNGSGKSTMLKLLAGIYNPTKGSVQVNGSLTPFIELGVGFNPELTGRENVFLNGALLGFNRTEVNAMYDDIVNFAELKKFMDQKLKNYSSGMQVRLAFSIAIRAKTDILLLDEVLAVGDQNFQDKCFRYFEEIKKSNGTVVFISHDSGAIERFCSRVAIIDRGELVDIGDPREMVFRYGAIMAGEAYSAQEKAGESKQARQGTGQITLAKTRVLDKDGKVVQSIRSGQPFSVQADFTLHDKKPLEVVIGIDIIDNQGISIFGPNTKEANKQPLKVTKNGSFEVNIPLNPLAPNDYTITVGIFNEKSTFAYDLIEAAAKFNVIGEPRHGKIYIEPKWSFTESA
jgi:ABC-2 type transport system ATP-binding protein